MCAGIRATRASFRAGGPPGTWPPSVGRVSDGRAGSGMRRTRRRIARGVRNGARHAARPFARSSATSNATGGAVTACAARVIFAACTSIIGTPRRNASISATPHDYSSAHHNSRPSSRSVISSASAATAMSHGARLQVRDGLEQVPPPVRGDHAVQHLPDIPRGCDTGRGERATIERGNQPLRTRPRLRRLCIRLTRCRHVGEQGASESGGTVGRPIGNQVRGGRRK